jgi:hypothetical protein
VRNRPNRSVPTSFVIGTALSLARGRIAIELPNPSVFRVFRFNDAHVPVKITQAPHRRADCYASVMTTPRPETIDREREKLFVTDAELYHRIGLNRSIARPTIAMLDKNHQTTSFPQKQPLWGNRRYWPAVKAWFDWQYGLPERRPPASIREVAERTRETVPSNQVRVFQTLDKLRLERAKAKQPRKRLADALPAMPSERRPR